MQELVYAALVPHPPILIPAVGGKESERVKSTFAAMSRLAEDLIAIGPDSVVIISPHGPVFRDAVAVHMLPQISGSLGDFGAPGVAFTLPVDLDLGMRVRKEAEATHLPVAAVTPERAADWDAEVLDHGTMVPLCFLYEAGWRGPILPIAMSFLPTVDLYAFGQALQRAIDRSGRKVAVLASGDLSHRLLPEAPAGYSPEGKRFDREVVEALGRGDLMHLFQMDPGFCEEAGPCALRPLMMLAGVLDEMQIKPQVLAYEGPFGVGYAVAEFTPGGRDPGRAFLPILKRERQERLEQRRMQMHPAVSLAREALEHFVRTDMSLDFSAGAPHDGTVSWRLPDDLPDRAGVFVSLKVDGELRGCIGSTEPTEPTLAQEIVRNAILAGTQDPRFPPVEEEKLADLEYSVDLLEPAEPCSRADLDPKVYGVIVTKDRNVGLLLPDLAGVDTVDEQISIACRKAGIDPQDSGIKLKRFKVRRLR